ncbi:acyltransferase [Epilithonimonas vandammei]|uniref:acyltransferase n=1 Tax=Epilithonimonas vandammei TaxID=2487072 RepID=UPI0028AA4FBC|nr:acyltransferase [Epilithonimonas vandammei]
MEKNRFFNIDLLKAISIFGVVYIHSYDLLGFDLLSQIFQPLFRIAVPSFIIIWAYFFEKSFQKVDRKVFFILEKFKKLFIVFIFWSIIYFLISFDSNNISLKSFITKHMSGYGWSGQYFFIILFQLIIFYPFIRKIYSLKWLRFLIIILVFIYYFVFSYTSLIPKPFSVVGIRPFVFWLPYVFLGIYFQRCSVNLAKSIPIKYLVIP